MIFYKIHAHVYAGVLLDILAAFFYSKASRFRVSDAATWPKAILVLIMIFATMLALDGIKKTRETIVKKEEKKIITFSVLAGVIGGMGIMVIYGILMQFTGFFVATAIFLPVAMWLLGQRNWFVMIGVTVGMEIFVYVLFVLQLKLRMP